MTLLDSKHAEIVKLNRVDGLSVRKVAKQVNVDPSTVTRTINAFRRELSVFLGALDRHTPSTLRDVTIAVLKNADTVRATAA